MPTPLETESVYPWEIVVLGAIVSIMLILGLWKLVILLWNWAWSPSHDPHQLFRKLARLHRLNRDELQVLKELQRNRPTPFQPASLFVDPSTWLNTSNEKSDRQSALQSTKSALFTKLFGFEIDRYRYDN